MYMGNKVAALEHAKRAVSLEPSNAEYRQLLEMLQSGGDFYDNYSGTSKVIEVSKDVYECMMTAYYQTKRYYQQYDRHQPLVFDETETGEALNAASPAADRICFEKLESEAVKELLNRLAPDVSRMIYLRFVEEMSLREIAYAEGTTISRTWRSIQKGLADLKELIVNTEHEFLDLI